MLIKKNLKMKRLVSCSIILKLKKQPFPIYPTRKKQSKFETPSPRLFSSLTPKIEQALLESLPYQLSTRRQTQKEKRMLRFLYPIHFFSFQRKSDIPETFPACTVKSTLVRSKKESNIFAPLAQSLGKELNLRIVFKSYNSQAKDIEISIAAVSKLVYFLDSCCAKQFKIFLTNSPNLVSFGFYSSFSNLLDKVKNVNYSNPCYPGISSTVNLLSNFKTWLQKTSLQRKQKAKSIEMQLGLLVEQPLIGFSGTPCKVVKEQGKNLSAFLLLVLQKTNYYNRFFFKSSVFLDNNSPIDKQMQKTFNSTQLFTLIRSPFVFKKTREQFGKQQLSYSVTIGLHSPVQKQLLIQYLSLLRLPVELEIHC